MFRPTQKKTKVVVGMSGGVDSSVAAALLKEQGYNAVGVFLRLSGTPAAGRENRRYTTAAELRARQTAAMLEMPFVVLDAAREFEKKVVGCFLRAEKSGLTPNPCVDCNRWIKFGVLLYKSVSMGCDFVATGHYAQIKRGKDGTLKLLKGKDRGKDQSYFLWRLGQKQLARIIFPVGGILKSDVRKIAKKLGLPSAETAESQEICFAGGSIDDFLARRLGQKRGRVVDMAGNVLGAHAGLWHYTIGQRKGIRLAGGPYYVQKKDVARNRLVVTKNKADLLSDVAVLRGVNWIEGRVPALPARVRAKIRYRTKEAPAVIKRRVGTYAVVFDKPQAAVTPGQSVVFYQGQRILGGGIVAQPRSAAS